ncbi:OmpA family protein [Neolewinella aurantiaca]|uniref:OmpA family protein n=1 Tax=Neolewinella aurantiaca TaxID=2602767 RepID=A0A5C7FGW9_9BACT|nr:OmpA family protein [Neolewinella aurantiaca]TXF90457.1 OmpA family protein [Neolewinella aurantiaca]
MLRLLFSLLVYTSPLLLWAQVMGYVDSVEVHRTDTIYFEFGSDELDDTALTAVNALAADRPGALELYLEGHTDAVGSDQANDDLARRRSENTRQSVLAAGWPEEAVELRYFGENRLAVRSAGKERLNRRVLLRSGLPRRYARFRGRITSEDGTPIPGGAIARSRYLKDTVRADDQGYYELILPLDMGIRLDIYARGHFFSSQTLILSEGKPVPPLVTKLSPAIVGSKMKVEDLYFVGNQTNLLAESAPTLPRLLQFMRTTPELRIELSGHVNNPAEPQGPGSWSYNLAINRAKVIYDYLVKFGIPKERLSFKGYSNWEMVNPKPKNSEEMRANRRVEIRVLEVVEPGN